MPIIILIVALAAMKYFEVAIVDDLSWWWIIALFAVAFIWFEFLERIFGLDKRKAHDKLEKHREERVKKAFDTKNRR